MLPGGRKKNIARFKTDNISVDLHRAYALGIAHHLPIGVRMQMIDLNRCVNTSRELDLGHSVTSLLLG